MGRPREFDEAEVLDRALTLFWRKGFEATSIRDLVEETGVARASLYGAFGDKEDLFRRALAHYKQMTGEYMQEVAAAATATEAIEALLLGWVGLTCRRAGPRGCFLILSGSAGDVPLARDALSAALLQIEKLIEAQVKRGQATGEIARHHAPTGIAKFVVVQLLGLATAARSGWGRERLMQSIAETMAHLRG